MKVLQSVGALLKELHKFCCLKEDQGGMSWHQINGDKGWYLQTR